MLVTDLQALIEYCRVAPSCDGAHQWVRDEEFGYEYCARCFVIKEDNGGEIK